MEWMRSVILILLAATLVSCQQSSNDIPGFVEGELTYLSSPAAGKLMWLGVKRGDPVNKDQILYRLDLEPEQSAMVAAQNRMIQAKGQSNDVAKPARATQLGIYVGQLKEAIAAVVLAQQRLERMRILFKKQVIDKDNLDDAQSTYDQAQAKVASLQSQVDEAKLGGRVDAQLAASANAQANAADFKRSEWTVTQKTGSAPGDGMVFDTYYLIGEYIPEARPVLSLLLPQNIHVEFYISAEQLGKIKIGDNIKVMCAGCRDLIDAKINYISPVAEYTPPVIYSLENHPKLAFRILARPQSLVGLHPGQPLTIHLSS